MKVVTHYESKLIQFENSHELMTEAPKLEKDGWKCSNFNYGSLRCRYRRELTEDETLRR